MPSSTMESVSRTMEPNHPEIHPIDKIARARAQLDSLLAVLAIYYDQEDDGGDTLNPQVLRGYVWQMEQNVEMIEDGLSGLLTEKVSQRSALS